MTQTYMLSLNLNSHMKTINIERTKCIPSLTIRDESDQLIGSSKGMSWGYIAEGPGKSIEC